jgi:ABC-type transporter Mla subunit MlaD
MVLASAATYFTFGLLVTFLGIGILVNGLLVYVAIQVSAERRQNLDYQASLRRSAGSQ